MVKGENWVIFLIKSNPSLCKDAVQRDVLSGVKTGGSWLTGNDGAFKNCTSWLLHSVCLANHKIWTEFIKSKDDSQSL